MNKYDVAAQVVLVEDGVEGEGGVNWSINTTRRNLVRLYGWW